MKHLLTIAAAFSLAFGSAYAGCGKTETDKGTLKAYDAEKKQITVELADGKSVSRTLTPTSKLPEKIEDAIGKPVSVVSSHGKVESVTKG